jgi:hypothetical protein
MAGRWVACEDAPSTYDGLVRVWHGKLAGAPLPVYSGGCEATIYGAPEVNHAFRAWHDAVHVRLGAAFTVEGEVRTALAQLWQARYLGASKLDLARLRADTIGQVAYFVRTGGFVKDQARYVAHVLEGWGV